MKLTTFTFNLWSSSIKKKNTVGGYACIQSTVCSRINYIGKPFEHNALNLDRIYLGIVLQMLKRITLRIKYSHKLRITFFFSKLKHRLKSLRWRLLNKMQRLKSIANFQATVFRYLHMQTYYVGKLHEHDSQVLIYAGMYTSQCKT